MATRMQQRRGTAAQWTAANPVLAAGEIGFETDTNKFKMGDGVNTWANLTYFVDQDAIDGSLGDYVESSLLGAADGVATLDENGDVPLSQLGNVPAPDFTGYATESYVTTAISNLIDAAPAALDTLNELAAALGDDANFATTVTNAIAGKQNNIITTQGDLITGSASGTPERLGIGLENQILQSNGTSLIWAEPPSTEKTYAVFTSSGTWTVPADVTKIDVIIISGGGGGGGGAVRTTSTCTGGAGGGSSNILIAQDLQVSPAQSITIAVGAGGAGGTGPSVSGYAAGANGGVGASGGSSSITINGSTLAAANGLGGNGGVQTTDANAIITSLGAGVSTVKEIEISGNTGGNSTLNGGTAGASNFFSINTKSSVTPKNSVAGVSKTFPAGAATLVGVIGGGGGGGGSVSGSAGAAGPGAGSGGGGAFGANQVGGAGGTAAPNTGAGGGGGGGASWTNTTSLSAGAGGAGGSGLVVIGY